MAFAGETNAAETKEPMELRPEGKMPKEWELSDDFEDAPKRPDDDPWKAILDPLLEKENIRCNAWKDEVHNLLIFAGLFSGVTTGFVIQSYKTLQRDPNLDVINLLSRIAARLDNPVQGMGNISSDNQVTLPASFSPTSSAVRVNIYWFLSLILSLTTVLVGIISLQWLREHQSYPGRSARETLAIYRMRAEGLERWHVWKIFTALPLLLQAALVLFFAGMIDFLHALGNRTVVIPITIIIGLVLLFLLATTVLPALQHVVLHLRFLILRRPPRPPSQCPYKSPQSGAFHAAIFMALKLYGLVLYCLFGSSVFDGVKKALTTLSISLSTHTHILLYLTRAWSQVSWIDYDLTWLSVRDACQDIYFGSRDGQSLNSAEIECSVHHGQKSTHPFPLFDITQMLRQAISNVNSTDDSLSAVYYCFSDLSRSLLERDRSLKDDMEDRLTRAFNSILQRNRYFHLLMCDDGGTETDYDLFSPPIPHPFIDFGTVKLLSTFDSNADILHHQNLFMFLDHLNQDYSRGLINHRAEIIIRLGKALYKRHTILLPTVIGSVESPLQLPIYLKGDTGFFEYISYTQQGYKGKDFKLFFQQYSYMLIEFFKHSAKPHGRLSGYSGCLHAHQNTVKFLETAGVHSYIAIAPYVHDIDTQERRNRIKALTVILTTISKSLDTALQLGRPRDSLYLFYTSAIYIRCLYCLILYQDSQDQGYNALLVSICDVLIILRRYKGRTIDIGETDPELEDQFKGNDTFYHRTSSNEQSSRFSTEWWCFLDGRTSHCRVPLSTKLQIAMAGRLHRPKSGKPTNIYAETPKSPGGQANNPISVLRALVTASSAGNLRARLHLPLNINRGANGLATTQVVEKNKQSSQNDIPNAASFIAKINPTTGLHSVSTSSDPNWTDIPREDYFSGRLQQAGVDVYADTPTSPRSLSLNEFDIAHAPKMNPLAHDLV